MQQQLHPATGRISAALNSRVVSKRCWTSQWKWWCSCWYANMADNVDCCFSILNRGCPTHAVAFPKCVDSLSVAAELLSADRYYSIKSAQQAQCSSSFICIHGGQLHRPCDQQINWSACISLSFHSSMHG